MNTLVSMRLLEFHIAHHCNLTCDGCSHFAPTAPRWLADAEALEGDIRRAAARLDPDWVHVLGGEPLLHDGVAELIPLFRAGFPRAAIKLVTNGVLLPRASTALYRALADNRVMVAISIYPGVRVRVEEIAARCAEAGVEVEFWPQETFLDFVDREGRADPHHSRAHCPMQNAANVRDGRLYPCPVAAWADFGHLPWTMDDGVPLDGGTDLTPVFDAGRPTSCCRFCRADAPRVPHRLARRAPQGEGRAHA